MEKMANRILVWCNIFFVCSHLPILFLRPISPDLGVAPSDRLHEFDDYYLGGYKNVQWGKYIYFYLLYIIVLQMVFHHSMFWFYHSLISFFVHSALCCSLTCLFARFFHHIRRGSCALCFWRSPQGWLLSDLDGVVHCSEHAHDGMPVADGSLVSVGLLLLFEGKHLMLYLWCCVCLQHISLLSVLFCCGCRIPLLLLGRGRCSSLTRQSHAVIFRRR
jgi:hypothetical protein